MSSFNSVPITRNYTETNSDLSCRGYDIFQDCIFFHSPVIGLGARMEDGPEKEAWFKKHNKKCAFFPTRALSCLQPGRGKIILPKGNEDVVKLWDFFKAQLCLDDDQVIWFEHNLENSMEHSLMNDPEACAKLKEIVDSAPAGSQKRQLFIFCNRQEILQWAADFGLEVVYDTKEWRAEFGFKSILHPRANEEQSYLQSMMPPGVVVPVPRGYNCSNTAELMMAVEKMRNDPGPPMTDVCIKPIGASDGDGIEFVSLSDTEKFEKYHFPMGDIALEEKLRLDTNPDGSLMTVVTHFCGDKLFGPSCDQLVGNAISSTAFIGNVYPSECPRPVRKKCELAVQELLTATRPKGPGGYDFLFQDGEPFLVDVNCGRFNGGMYPKAFHKQFASRNSAYVSFKHYNPRCTLDECMAAIKSNGWEFVPILPAHCGREVEDNEGERGIFPLVHLPGALGSYIAIANTREECIQMKDAFMALDL